jgi:UDP-N-acetyl-D-glucosamine/UDP-N-acetyl-D-galactosamine dehydrogenase
MIKICVMGLGYVGLPLALNVSKNFKTVGFDINKKRIAQLKKHHDGNFEFKKKDFKNKNIEFTGKINKIDKCTYYIICVPTPIDQKNKPELSALIKAFNILKKVIKIDDTVVLESTVFPGVTNQFGNFLQKNTGLRTNKDFFICYSPERINPGDSTKKLNQIDKIFSTKIKDKKKINDIKKIYSLVSKKLIFTKKIQESEAAKVIENIQRDLNIAFYNEILMICDKLKLNFSEVIRLASTKWNFLKFNPGLVGGHCLPVDPYYLSYISKKNNLNLKTTLAGRETNNLMKKFVLDKFNEYFKDNFLSHKSKILIIGITYKYGVSDMRNSINYEIFRKIKKKCPKTLSYDPFINIQGNLVKIPDLTKIDVFLFLSNGEKFKKIYSLLKTNKKKIIDPFKYYSKN